MTDLERRIKESFDAIDLPVGLNERTLAAIEAQRAEDASTVSRQQGAPHPALKVRRGGKGIRRAVVALAACLALAAVGFGGAAWYMEPTAYLDVEVNPSIELGINRLNRVVSSEALNADAESVLAGAQLQHKTVDEALSVLVAETSLSDYLNDDAYIEVSVASDDEVQRAALQKAGERCVAALPCEGVCRATTMQDRAGKRHAGGVQSGQGQGKGSDSLMGGGRGDSAGARGAGQGQTFEERGSQGRGQAQNDEQGAHAHGMGEE